MPENPSASEYPLRPAWANRRVRGSEATTQGGHPWSTRRNSSAEMSQRFSSARTVQQSSDPRTGAGDEPPAEPPPNEPDLTDLAPEVLAGFDLLAGAEDLDDSGGGRDPLSEFAEELEEELAQEEASGRNARSRPSVRRLGAGLVVLPRVKTADPRAAVLEDPEVPELKRFCWNCQDPVGRSGPGCPAAIAGECRRCRSPFNFRPALDPGELVADQYEVKGCLAHGGLGWIYLAVDRNVSDRWVVLKGLQNPQDFEAHVVALAERQFLSEIDYPGVVKIYNFVKYRSARDITDGYIVMEYVGGRSLKTMLDLAAPEHIPVAEAIAYTMEILPALDYLHSFGLAYNDLKPDNIMVTEDEVKLIDLGAVAAMESYGSIYGTPGYQAPEILQTGPTVVSDIYAVGRTLAALTLDLEKDDEGNYRRDLPDASESELLRRYPYLHRLLARATDPDPNRRFPSAYAMYCQLAGVLRMVLAADTGREYPQASIEFGSRRGDFGVYTLIGQTDGVVDGQHHEPALAAEAVVEALSIPLLDAEDPSADLLSSLLHGDPRHALDALSQTYERIEAETIAEPETFALEGPLTAIRAHVHLKEVEQARTLLAGLRPRFDADWRIEWYSGLAALLEGNHEQAYQHFDEVHTMLPGELAPPLALAATAELAMQRTTEPAAVEGWHRAATEFYQLAWQTNHEAVSAAFGTARRLVADGRVYDAVAVLEQVPNASRHHNVATMTGCLLLVSQPSAELTEMELTEAARRLEQLPEDPRLLQLQVTVVGAALEWVRVRRRPAASDTEILGFPLTEGGLRGGLESRLRTLARTVPDRLHRYRLVDLANSIRPHSRW